MLNHFSTNTNSNWNQDDILKREARGPYGNLILSKIVCVKGFLYLCNQIYKGVVPLYRF